MKYAAKVSGNFFPVFLSPILVWRTCFEKITAVLQGSVVQCARTLRNNTELSIQFLPEPGIPWIDWLKSTVILISSMADSHPLQGVSYSYISIRDKSSTKYFAIWPGYHWILGMSTSINQIKFCNLQI